MPKHPSRFAKRMAHRLAKAIGKANKQVNNRFANNMGVKEAARVAAATQFRHFTRTLVQLAQAAERAELGNPLSHKEHMLRRKELRHVAV